jgi:hypothetical protein
VRRNFGPSDDPRLEENSAWVEFVATAGGASGYYNPEDLTDVYEYQGQLYNSANYQALMQQQYWNQISAQCDRANGNLPAGLSADCSNPQIVGGHAITLDCGADPTNCTESDMGRYEGGIHVGCPGGGYTSCVDPSGDLTSSLWVHDDTVSPWVGPFTFSSTFSGDVWEHAFVDLMYGSICNCVLPH